jgi:hypothetical protein
VVVNPLPDRDRRHLLQFYVAPKLEYRRRLAWASALILAGLGIQFLVPFESVVVMLVISVPLLLVGNSFLFVRGYNLKPAAMNKRPEWEKTTRDRFQKTRQIEQQVKRWDESFTDLTCVSGAVGLALVLMASGVIWIVIWTQPMLRFWAPVWVADAAVLLLPHWITGTRRGWRPIALRQQIDALETALKVLEKYESPPCQIQPMFEMVGEKKQRVPRAARVFVRFPDGPDEFLGIQFQVALNNVQGTNYPYLYAVIVARPEFGLLTDYLPKVQATLESRQARTATGWLDRLRAKRPGKLTVESNRESEVDVIVIRQTTTKNSGYHTDGMAIARIAHAAWQGTARILELATAVKTQVSS